MPRRAHLPSSSSSSLLSPRRLALQILALQTLYYTTLLLLTLFTTLIFGRPFSLSLLLDWRAIRSDTAMGWSQGLLIYLFSGAVAGILLLLWLIGRSKLVPDFVLTLHAIHTLLVFLFTWHIMEYEARVHGRNQHASWMTAIPQSKLWWALTLGSAVLMGAGGSWACRWRELRPIAGFSQQPSGKQSNTNTNTNTANGAMPGMVRKDSTPHVLPLPRTRNSAGTGWWSWTPFGGRGLTGTSTASYELLPVKKGSGVGVDIENG